MTITVTWLGHATVVVDMDGVRIVSDPLLRRHNGILRRRGGATPDADPDAAPPDAAPPDAAAPDAVVTSLIRTAPIDHPHEPLAAA